MVCKNSMYRPYAYGALNAGMQDDSSDMDPPYLGRPCKNSPPLLPARVLVNECGQFEALGYEAEQIYAQEIEQGFPRRENIRCLLQRLRCDLSAQLTARKWCVKILQYVQHRVGVNPSLVPLRTRCTG